MPRAPRVTKGQGIYRSTPFPIVSAPTTSRYHQFNKTELPEINMESSQQYAMNGAMNGGPVQPLHYRQPARPRNSSWPPQADEILLECRAKGMGWPPIQAQYFPDKSANACRKRHERLITTRSSNQDWEGEKMEELAEHYMAMRETIWKPLADQMGERWAVVESKCMSQGWKNLQRLSRKYNRERRLQEDGQAVAVQEVVSHVPHGHVRHHSGQLPAPYYGTNRNSIGRYDDRGDDSSGISVFDDADNGYSPNGGDQSFRSSGEYISNEPMGRSDEQHWNLRATMQSSRDTLGVMHPQQPQPSYARLDGRLDQRYAMPAGVPSTDMRIPALINGPNNILNALNGHGHEAAMSRPGHDSGMNGHVNGMGGHGHSNGGRN